MPKIHTKSGFRGPKSDDRRVLSPKNTFLGSGSGLAMFLVNVWFSRFGGEKCDFWPQNAQNTHKIGISGPKIGRQACFYSPKNTFLGCRCVFAQYVISAFWGRKMRFWHQNGQNTHKIGISGPKIRQTTGAFLWLKNACLGSVSGLGVFLVNM